MSAVICHFLIGIPGSGKSTLAQQWVAQNPDLRWISTDSIRQDLYGDASIQGSWPQIEAEVLRQIRGAIAEGRSVLYDATNAKRPWRIDFLRKLADQPALWMGWHLKTPLNVCLQRNQQRDRQVLPDVIRAMDASLKRMPPWVAEGFASVQPVAVTEGAFDLSRMQERIDALPKTLKARQVRQAPIQLHPYSDFLDFERLLYLLALLLQDPDMGASDNDAAPDADVQQLSARLAQHHGPIYADPDAIAQNLAWLHQNHFLNSHYSCVPLYLDQLPHHPAPVFHRYADPTPFKRLMLTIRYLSYHPFACQSGRSQLKSLSNALAKQDQAFTQNEEDNLRRDIQEILKPYGLMTQKPQRQGYFVGNAILSQADLLQVFHCLEGQAQHLDDPIALKVYDTFRQRLEFLEWTSPLKDRYPIRTVLHQPIVDGTGLSPDTGVLAVPSNSLALETAIATAQPLILQRLRGAPRPQSESEQPFEVLPLQIAFHNIGWYLGYQRRSDGLLRFERLDRLKILGSASFVCQKQAQQHAYQQLLQLYEASFGIFLGLDAQTQQQFLSADPKVRAQVETPLDLWFNDAMFRFICEGTRRFPRLKMSKRPDDMPTPQAQRDSIFTAKGTGDFRFPHRLQAVVPHWVVSADYEFKRWLLGFGAQVKVHAPVALAQDLQAMAQAIVAVYPVDEP